MAALDTNVLVSYIVQDDAAPLAAAKRLISRCVSEGLNNGSCLDRLSAIWPRDDQRLLPRHCEYEAAAGS